MSFDLGQTFYIDKQAVQKADAIVITSVDLYFRNKPVEGRTESGISKPGVTVALCGVNEDGSPDLTDFLNLQFAARVEYDNVSTSATGDAATRFTFAEPLVVATDRSYGFVIRFDGVS